MTTAPGARDRLLQVLRDVRRMLARPGNDYTWSSWDGPEDALAELDSYIAAIEAGRPLPSMLLVLFAPTGPLQEVSISSGWGDEFLALASRFDDAVRDSMA